MSESKAAAAASILYVEDEDLNWRITERNLRGEFVLTRARNAWDVFAHLAQQPFDLILLDIQLSGSDLDGISIARILRGTYSGQPPMYALPPPNGSTIPIVFTTAYGIRYTKNSLLQVGGTEVIYKPVNFPLLTAVIGRLTQNDSRRKTVPPLSDG